MAKYYLAHNAGREIAGERFEITSILGGSAIGVFAAYKEDQIAKLDKLAADPRTAVFEIPLSEYDDELKKKAPLLKGFRASTQESPPTNLRDPVAVVVEGVPAVDDTEAGQLETLEGALSSVAEIEPSPTADAVPQPRRSQRKANAQ